MYLLFFSVLCAFSLDIYVPPFRLSGSFTLLLFDPQK